MRESGTKAAEVMMTGGAKEVEESPAEKKKLCHLGENKIQQGQQGSR